MSFYSCHDWFILPGWHMPNCFSLLIKFICTDLDIVAIAQNIGRLLPKNIVTEKNIGRLLAAL